MKASEWCDMFLSYLDDELNELFVTGQDDDEEESFRIYCAKINTVIEFDAQNERVWMHTNNTPIRGFPLNVESLKLIATLLSRYT